MWKSQAWESRTDHESEDVKSFQLSVFLPVNSREVEFMKKYVLIVVGD